MPRPFQLPLFALVFELGAAAVSAAEFTPLLRPEPAAPAPTSPAPSRAISPELAAKMAAAVPFYLARTPTAAPPPATASTAATTVAPDTPANGIIRLPRVVVQEKKLPAIPEREILTSRAKAELTLKRYPGLRLPGNSIWVEAFIEEELTGRPPWKLPVHFSGPEQGLVVPWERK